MGLLTKTVGNLLCKHYTFSSGTRLNTSLQIINIQHIVSLAATKPAVLIERAAQVVDTDISHFDIRNLLQQEHDLSIFTLDRVSKLEADLVTVEHPIINVAHEIFEHDENKSRTSLGGFCLLLLAKSLQSVPSNNITPEIWKKQKIFAECYEMIDKAMYLHHHAIIDIPTENETLQTTNAKNKGNKLAVLGGDYLFSYAIVRLSREVRPATVFDFIGASIDEFCINHFDDPAKLESIKQSSVSNSSLSSLSIQENRNNYPWDRVDRYYWEKYGGYCSTHLLAYCSQYACKMAHLASMRYEKAAFKFGYNLRLLWNLKDDLESLENEKAKLNVISLPLILCLEANPEFRRRLSKLDLDDNELREEIRRILLNSDAISRCQSSIMKYSNECLKALKVFPNCLSRDVLISIFEEN